MISGNLCYDLIDHLPNFLIVSKLSSLPASTKVFRRDYSNLDKEILISDIQSIDWNGLNKKIPDPSSMFDNFILSYLRLLTYMYLSSNYLSKISKLNQAMDNVRTSIIHRMVSEKFSSKNSKFYRGCMAH